MTILNIEFTQVQKRANWAARFKGFLEFTVSLELSFPVLVHFVGRFVSTVWGSLCVAARAQVHLVHLFERLVQVVLKWGHGSADGRRAKAVSDEAKMGQAALDPRLQDGRWPRVSQGWAVLSQQIREFLADLSEGRRIRTWGKHLNSIQYDPARIHAVENTAGTSTKHILLIF